MEINEELIAYLEQLSRFRLSDQEKEVAGRDLQNILGHCNMLDGLDVTGVEGISNPFGNGNVMREDVMKPSLSQDRVLQNAPQQQDGYFVVPKTVE